MESDANRVSGSGRKKRGIMTHQVLMWVVPVLAIIFGLLLFVTSKDRWATIGGYVFLCGFLIAIWILTFGGYALR
jgi:hypothetical protein